MKDTENHVAILFTAELQFRLASAVRLATTLQTQSLDLPTEWVHGNQSVEYNEIALLPEQADYAAHFLHQSTTFLLATAVRDALRTVFSEPKNSTDDNIRSAYQIARLIRNAFSHSPFSPKWSIDEDCQDKVFEIPDVIKLDTKNLNGKTVNWQDYGGSLAIFRFARFVRIELLGDNPTPRKTISTPNRIIHQQGNLILMKVDEIPPDAVKIEPEKLIDGGISIGNGHFLYAKTDDSVK